MKEKILAALVAVNGQYNLPKDYLEKVALTAPDFESEDKIAAWVDSQKPMLAVMQSYADSRVSSMKKELDDLRAAKGNSSANEDLDKRLGVFKEDLTKMFEGRISALEKDKAELTEKLNGYETASKTAEFEEIKKRVAKELGLSDVALKFASGRLTSDMDESKINEVLSECKKEMISMGLSPIEGQHYQHTSADAASAYAKSYLDDKERELNK